jgi:hypothetical protein
VRHRLTEGQAIARVLSVLVFFCAALLSVFSAQVEEAEEAYITWDDRYVQALLIFGGANLVAAGLAAFPGRSVTLRAVGPLTLIPAVMLMSEYKGSVTDARWLLWAALTLVVAGGFIAGVAVMAPRRDPSERERRDSNPRPPA